MLDSVKTYIKNAPNTNFTEYYQRYICSIQDQNIIAEVNSVKTDDILSLDRLIAKLMKEIH